MTETILRDMISGKLNDLAKLISNGLIVKDNIYTIAYSVRMGNLGVHQVASELRREADRLENSTDPQLQGIVEKVKEVAQIIAELNHEYIRLVTQISSKYAPLIEEALL